ncbi:MAG: cell division protein FtsZ, partial [Candidatus Paceibacteria bacterium]
MPQNRKSKYIPIIKIAGIGGAGGNAITRMAEKIHLVETIAINTDLQDLGKTIAKRRIQIGKTLTGGRGAGMNPEIGRQAAEENKDDIAKALDGAELVFLTCGLGGGTGSGATPVIADIAKSLGALTVAVVTMPFEFEGAQRKRIAETSWENLVKVVDAIITVPNDRIFALISRTTPINKAFYQIDEVLRSGVQGIVDLISRPGLINIDFADVKTILETAGPSLLSIGYGAGENRARTAAEFAINSPLLDVTIDGAKGVLFSVSARSLTLSEVHDAANIITESIDRNARVIFGATFDPKIEKKEAKVTVVATG